MKFNVINLQARSSFLGFHLLLSRSSFPTPPHPKLMFKEKEVHSDLMVLNHTQVNDVKVPITVTSKMINSSCLPNSQRPNNLMISRHQAANNLKYRRASLHRRHRYMFRPSVHIQINNSKLNWIWFLALWMKNYRSWKRQTQSHLIIYHIYIFILNDNEQSGEQQLPW